MNEKHIYSEAEAEKGYWEACADYDMTRQNTPLDWRLQGFAADQVALWRERWIKAAQRVLDARVDRRARAFVATTLVQIETGEPREFYETRKRK